MLGKRLPPRVRRVEETEIGRRLATDPAAQVYHRRILAEFAEANRPERKADERARRITGDDLRQRID